MATEFYIAKMSDHMDEAVFVEWLVAEGDAVEKGQPIMVVDTDKVVAELESPADGFLKGIRPGLDEGVTIAIGVTVAYVVEDLAEDVPSLDPIGAATAGTPSADESDAPEVPAPTEAVPAETLAGRSTTGPVRATPAARKAARELGIEMTVVTGSGPGGRISESDVRGHASGPTSAESDAAGEDFLSLTSVQRVTARRMVVSIAEVPQFSLVQRIDMTAVLRAREKLGSEAATPPSVTAFLVKALALALVQHPRVNGFFHDGRIEVNHEVNVGVAMGTPEGLYVPVIRDADKLSVAEIADELRRLKALADARKFAPSDLEGGTSTLSNLGMFGIDEFRAIVNPPQSTILATGRVTRVPVVNGEGYLGSRDEMTATITADHRSLDGVAAALFLASVSELLIRPDEKLGSAS